MTPEFVRIQRLKRIMADEDIEALLITRREDVRYFSGFTGSAGSLLVAAGKPCLITDFRYQLQAARQAKGASVLIQKKDFFEALRGAADQRGVKTIWFDESSLTVEILKKLKNTGLKARQHRNLAATLRLRKDRSELVHLRTAVRRAEEAFRGLKRSIVPGVTERELGIKLDFLIREQGSSRTAFDTIVASGMNAAMPHASITGRRIRQGDLITFDFGAEADGYFCDMTRTYCVGRPTAKQREIHELVLQAQAAAMKLVRPGIACRSVDGGARERIKEAGHGEHFGHGTGHGVGLMVHEGPSVSPLSKDRVEQDMVFTIEPGVYIPGWGGVRIEDMVLVTEKGAKTLTNLPRAIDGLKTLEEKSST